MASEGGCQDVGLLAYQQERRGIPCAVQDPLCIANKEAGVVAECASGKWIVTAAKRDQCAEFGKHRGVEQGTDTAEYPHRHV